MLLLHCCSSLGAPASLVYRPMKEVIQGGAAAGWVVGGTDGTLPRTSNYGAGAFLQQAAGQEE